MKRRLFPAIPLIVRLPVLMLLLITVAVFAVIGVVRALNPDPACLVIENNGERFTIDPYSDYRLDDYQMMKEIEVAAKPPATYAFGTNAVSPDRWHYARTNDQEPDQIEVGQYRIRPFFSEIWSERFSSEAFIQWSPNGQRIAIVDAQNTLRIADEQGKVLRSTQAPAGVTSFYLDSWSADSRYLAMLMELDGSLRLQLLDAETLSPVTSNPSLVHTGCTVPGHNNLICSPWAADGAHASYVEDAPPNPKATASGGSLVLVNAGKTLQTFALPESVDRTLARSNNGRWVAVVSFPTGDITSKIAGRLDVYGEDGTAITQIDAVVYTAHGTVDGSLIAEFWWSPDNHSLFYFRYSVMNPDTMELVRYDLQSRKSQTLLTVPSDRYFGTAFSADGTLLAISLLSSSQLGDNTPNARLIRISDGYMTSFDVHPIRLRDMIWKGNLLAYQNGDNVRQVVDVDIMDKKGTHLRRYPVPSTFPSMPVLYWSNCQ